MNPSYFTPRPKDNLGAKYTLKNMNVDLKNEFQPKIAQTNK